MKIETIKKTQTEEVLELENPGKRIGTIDSSITNEVQDTKERIWGVEDKIEEIDTMVKQNVKSIKFLRKHPGNLGHNEKTKPKNNRNRKGWWFPVQRARKYLQQNYTRKLN